MLKDTGPCTHNVRIGQDFQAEVPDWSGSSVDEVDTIGEPSEIDSSECVSLHVRIEIPASLVDSALLVIGFNAEKS
ncbi:unnamed protein product [Camellia sinensis]